MKKRLGHTFEKIISLENLLYAWQEFVKGKGNRKDVELFNLHLAENIFALHNDLKSNTYEHSVYQAFNISDPKPRNIHKASVRDRLFHHAIYRILYPYFDKKFIYDSYSCREGKGTHKAMNRFREFFRKESRNNTRTVWVLKCDIRKFFASIDHEVLFSILAKNIDDRETLKLLAKVIKSFSSTSNGVGLPLGNLTSQLLVNVYMNEFDQFVKQTLKAKYYIRYADDFVFLSHEKKYLEKLLPIVSVFLKEKLRLELHPNKVFIKTLSSGVDFLGWVHFSDHRVLRTTTKKRMFKRIQENKKPEVVESYIGLLKHGNTHKLSLKLPSST